MEYPARNCKRFLVARATWGSWLRVVNVSVHLSDKDRVAREEFLQEHITGAMFFDLDDIANALPREVSPEPAML
ncbi:MULTISPECIES: hypothetical protein [unclassified Burkholderia]|uniref:hypothetical protein n=1 Tax=unclassified Burkholderia TaxID=2613784 RepID=UPI002AAF69FC|nr:MULTISPECIES: hypothetical protein [unclassified Burkholderia]